MNNPFRTTSYDQFTAYYYSGYITPLSAILHVGMRIVRGFYERPITIKPKG